MQGRQSSRDEQQRGLTDQILKFIFLLAQVGTFME